MGVRVITFSAGRAEIRADIDVLPPFSDGAPSPTTTRSGGNSIVDTEPEVTAADLRFKGPATGWTRGNAGVKLDVEGPVTTTVFLSRKLWTSSRTPFVERCFSGDSVMSAPARLCDGGGGGGGSETWLKGW